MLNDAKLARLRARTDRDLLVLVERQLDRGLRFAKGATSKEFPFYGNARAAYVLASTWLPQIAGLPDRRRRELENTLRDLQVALERLPSEQTHCLAGVGIE